MAQVAKVAPDRFTMFVMPEFVTPDRYIYGVDNEYNGVVIRGECYDRQFMFGKGAGGSPTASSILSDVMARCHDYRYEYKKMGFANRPTFTDDVVLHVYARYNATDVVALLPWQHIDESYRSAEYKYVRGDVALSDLDARRKDLAEASDVFLCNLQGKRIKRLKFTPLLSAFLGDCCIFAIENSRLQNTDSRTYSRNRKVKLD